MPRDPKKIKLLKARESFDDNAPGAQAPDAGQEDFGKLLEMAQDKSVASEAGEIFLGKVIAEEGDFYLLDAGAKIEARLAKSEVPRELNCQSGNYLPVMFVRGPKEENAGRRLSFKAALRNLQRERLQQFFAGSQRLKAKIFRLKERGFFVGLYIGSERFPELSARLWELLPYPAFLPGDQLDRGDPHPLGRWINKMVEVKILSLDTGGETIVSRRKVLEQDYETRRQETLGKVKAGDAVDARVKEIRDTEMVLDVNGVEGYLTQDEASWYKQTDLRRFFRRGEILNLKVLQCEKDKNRLILSRRALLPHPADELVKKFNVGSIVEGEIVKVMAKGSCFVRLPATKREAYIPARELDAESEPKPGTKIKAKVIQIDRENVRVVLSPKKYEQTQFPDAISKYAKENMPIRLGEILKEGQ